MQHCSLDFINTIGLPVVAHSRWSEAQTQCALHLFADHGHALSFLPELPGAEAQDFAQLMMRCALPAEMGEGGMHRIEGVAALSLTNLLVNLHTRVQEVVRVAEAPDLMGFWEPPGWRVPSEGMILWFHPDSGYRTVIARARDQAAEAITRLSWLERRRKESLLAKISKWNAPRTSPHTAQEIGGVCAQALCLASAGARIREAMHAVRARHNALLN